jgi:SAM-dependent methyltransferase
MAFQDSDAYARFMGRFSEPLAPVFADFARLSNPARVIDVGCGPGVLTTELVRRFGAGAVAAVDPSEGFVAAARTRLPDVDVRRAAAEELPYEDDTFDAALAQLVVHFMADPVAGLTEMRRVARPGGVVAACVWDSGPDGGPLSIFDAAARELHPDVPGEVDRAGTREGHLAQLFGEAGLAHVEAGRIGVTLGFASFEEWWEPFTLGVGPAGDLVASLDDDARRRLAEACRTRLPQPPFELTVWAWAARGVVE